MTGALLFAALLAAEAPFFQMGSRLGLVPPPGLSARLECLCFMSDDLRASIMLTDGPREAFAQAGSAEAFEALKRDGLADARREEVVVDGRRAVLVSGTMKTRANVREHVWFLAVDAEPRAILVNGTIRSDALRRYRASDMRRSLLDARLRSEEEARASLPVPAR